MRWSALAINNSSDGPKHEMPESASFWTSHATGGWILSVNLAIENERRQRVLLAYWVALDKDEGHTVTENQTPMRTPIEIDIKVSDRVILSALPADEHIENVLHPNKLDKGVDVRWKTGRKES